MKFTKIVFTLSLFLIFSQNVYAEEVTMKCTQGERELLYKSVDKTMFNNEDILTLVNDQWIPFCSEERGKGFKVGEKMISSDGKIETEHLGTTGHVKNKAGVCILSRRRVNLETGEEIFYSFLGEIDLNKFTRTNHRWTYDYDNNATYEDANISQCVNISSNNSSGAQQSSNNSSFLDKFENLISVYENYAYKDPFCMSDMMKINTEVLPALQPLMQEANGAQNSLSSDDLQRYLSLMGRYSNTMQALGSKMSNVNC